MLRTQPRWILHDYTETGSAVSSSIILEIICDPGSVQFFSGKKQVLEPFPHRRTGSSLLPDLGKYAVYSRDRLSNVSIPYLPLPTEREEKISFLTLARPDLSPPPAPHALSARLPNGVTWAFATLTVRWPSVTIADITINWFVDMGIIDGRSLAMVRPFRIGVIFRNDSWQHPWCGHFTYSTKTKKTLSEFLLFLFSISPDFNVLLLWLIFAIIMTHIRNLIFLLKFPMQFKAHYQRRVGIEICFRRDIASEYCWLMSVSGPRTGKEALCWTYGRSAERGNTDNVKCGLIQYLGHDASN